MCSTPSPTGSAVPSRPARQGPAVRRRHRRHRARDPHRAAGGRRRAAGRPRLHRADQGAGQGRRGLAGAEPGAAGHQDRQRGARSTSSAARPAGCGFAKKPPTVIMLAGLQGSGKTTLAGKLAPLAQGPGPHAAAGGLRPAAPQRGDPAAGRRRARRRRRVRPRARATASATRSTSPAAASRTPARKQHDIVVVDTAGRLGVDAELMPQAADIRDAVQPDETLFVVDAMIGQDAVDHRRGVPRRRRLHRRRADQARRRRPRWRRAVGPPGHRPADHVRVQRREARGLRRLPPRPDGRRDPRHGRHAHPDRAGRAGLRRRARPRDGRARSARASSRWRTSSSRCWRSARWARSATCSGMLPGAGQMKDQLAQVDDRDLDRLRRSSAA